MKFQSCFFSLVVLSMISCGNGSKTEQPPVSGADTIAKVKQMTTDVAETETKLVVANAGDDAEVKVETKTTKEEAPKSINKKTDTDKVVENRPVNKEKGIPSADKPKDETSKNTTPSNNENSSATNPPQVVEEPVDKPVIKEHPPVKIEPEKPEQVTLSHEVWDKLLRANVSASGKVNYKGFKSNSAKLDAYLQALKANPPQSDWSRNQKLAYWINVYNAFTVKLITDNYPTSSITKLEGGKPWDKKWIKIDGKTYSLDKIENAIIRPTFKEPRIHFAVNCAAKSCPPLLNRAWTADNLERNLEQQTKSFINNTTYNKISDNKVQISKIFEWYAADFGNLIPYLNKYANTKIKDGTNVEFLEYDWALNE